MQKSHSILIYSLHPVEIPDVKYSHEYVEQIMKRQKGMNVFDPIIGKGLLAGPSIIHRCFKFFFTLYLSFYFAVLGFI